MALHSFSAPCVTNLGALTQVGSTAPAALISGGPLVVMTYISRVADQNSDPVEFVHRSAASSSSCRQGPLVKTELLASDSDLAERAS